MLRYCVSISFLAVFLVITLPAESSGAEEFWHYWKGKYWGNWLEELKEKIEKEEYPAWMIEQIQEDFSPFKETGIFEDNIPETIMNNRDGIFLVCSLVSGQAICSSYPVEVASDFRARAFNEVIQELAQSVPLPNMVFLLYIGDSFCGNATVPVLSWCKHKQYSPFTVNIPDYEALYGNDNFMIAVEKGAALYPWEVKRGKAIWRGSTTGFDGPLKFPPIKTDVVPRWKLIQLSAKEPDFVDAKFSEMFKEQYDDPSWRSKFEPYMGNPLQVVEQLQYRYQILVDGFVSAFSRTYWQLFSDCVIFKQNSPWYQWFYRNLWPYEHYIPYEADGSDLVEKIKWAIDHEDEVRWMVRNANEFARNHLKRSDVMLYLYLVLQEYAKLKRPTTAQRAFEAYLEKMKAQEPAASIQMDFPFFPLCS